MTKAKRDFPSIVQYNNAILNIATTGNAELRMLTPRTQGFGLPRVISGGFALTYELTDSRGRRFALRCFQEDHPDREHRYGVIAARLAAMPAEARRWFLETRYLADGLQIRGERYPVVLMAWAEGPDLGLFLHDHHRDRLRLEQVRRSLSDLAAFLDGGSPAHGDLQLGNIAVGGPAGLTLLDYDGLWFPELAALAQRETGHINFQHPLREEHLPGPTMDRFAAIVLEVGLRALIAAPELWLRFAGGENLLFSQADFVEPEQSTLMTELGRIAPLRRAIGEFVSICRGPFAAIPSLAEFQAATVGHEQHPAVAVGTEMAKPTDRPRRRAAPYRSPYPLLAATDLGAIRARVGQKIEAVGRIVTVKRGETKHGDDYVFVNFGDWRETTFKITIWSDGLDEFDEEPDEDWIGSWVSVTGLVDEPYVSERFGYTHYSITANNPTQLRRISAREAQFRLGKTTGGPETETTTKPRDYPRPTLEPIQARLKGRDPTPTVKSRNRALVERLGPSLLEHGGSTMTKAYGSNTPARATGAGSPQNPAVGSSPPASRGLGCFWAALAIGLVLFLASL